MLGRAYHQLKSRFGHGIHTAWYRDVLRPSVLQACPFKTDETGPVEIHVLTSVDDFLNMLWALKSFYHFSGRRYPLHVHDDGSVTNTQLHSLKHLFPNARYIPRCQADREVPAALANHPRSLKLRITNHLAAKVFDFRYYLGADRMLLLDSDVLFFREPTELLRRLEDPGYHLNSVNGDVASAYTVEPKMVKEQLGFDLIERFNSGLGVIHRESLVLDRVEDFLKLPEIVGHFWRIEQTLYALCSSRFGAELLPPEYDVFLSGEVGDRCSRHYVGAIRHLMYSEGMKKLSLTNRHW